MDKLNELIVEARNSSHGVVTYSNVYIEMNGSVIFYFIDEKECTAGEAIARLEELGW